MDKVELLTRVLQAEGPRPHHDLRADQAHRAAGRRRPRRPRIRRRRRARRPGPGRPRAGAARVPLRQGRRAGGHRRRRPRHRRRRTSPTSINYQCPEDAKTYVHRIGRTGRAGQDRRRGDPGRLGRAAAVEDDQRRPRARHAGGAGDLLHLRSTSSPTWRSPPTPGGACRTRSAPGRAWRPSTSTPRATTAGAGVVTATGSAVAATTRRRSTTRGRHVSGSPGPAAAVACCSGPTVRRSRPR